jgi:hypothetical protein
VSAIDGTIQIAGCLSGIIGRMDGKKRQDCTGETVKFALLDSDPPLFENVFYGSYGRLHLFVRVVEVR